MQLGALFENWCHGPAGRTVIVTDDEQRPLAETIRSEWSGCCDVILYREKEVWQPILPLLTPGDLVIALFSFNAFMDGARDDFPTFGKREWLRSRYAFVRLGISEASLRQGLSTEKALVQDKLREMSQYGEGQRLRVTNAAGTDITLAIHPFATCSHEIAEDGGSAFLPPSETSSDVMPETANGRIVVDVTVGQLYHFAHLAEPLGLVDAPVTLTVQNGMMTDVTGGEIARRLKAALFALSPDCRKLVELGQGLSQMTPTGLIGVDESILDTCHFGFGDGGACGVHLDVVISQPTVQPYKGE